MAQKGSLGGNTTFFLFVGQSMNVVQYLVLFLLGVIDDPWIVICLCWWLVACLSKARPPKLLWYGRCVWFLLDILFAYRCAAKMV